MVLFSLFFTATLCWSRIAFVNAFVPGSPLTTALTLGQGHYHTDILERAVLRTVKRFFNKQLKTSKRPLLLIPDESLTVENLFKEHYDAVIDKKHVEDVEELLDRFYTGNVWKAVEFEAALQTMKKKIISVDADSRLKDNPKYHFDAERFTEANELLASELEQVTALIKGHNFEGARSQAGVMFHTLQDFYAHSNWVEIQQHHRNVNPIPINRNLGIRGGHIGKLAKADQPTCLDCTKEWCRTTNIRREILEEKILTSGYYSGQRDDNDNPVLKPVLKTSFQNLVLENHVLEIALGKCSHGGQLDSTSRSTTARGGIAKDGPLSYEAPHRELHQTAAELAEEATMEFLERIHHIVGDINFSHFLAISEQYVAASVKRNRRSLAINRRQLAMNRWRRPGRQWESATDLYTID